MTRPATGPPPGRAFRRLRPLLASGRGVCGPPPLHPPLPRPPRIRVRLRPARRPPPRSAGAVARRTGRGGEGREDTQRLPRCPGGVLQLVRGKQPADRQPVRRRGGGEREGRPPPAAAGDG